MYTPILETERLILRPLTVDDANAVYEWASDERVARYMIYPKHETIDTTLEWLKSIDHSLDTEYEFGFEEKETGVLIGSGGVYWNDNYKQWRVGYNFRFDRWKKGFATEAAQEMVRFAREELKAEHIGSCHAVENPNSGRVLRNCGLVFTKYGEYEKFDGSVTFRCKEYLWTKNGEELTHHKGTVTLKTERLILRKFQKSDYKDIFKWASNPKVNRYVSYQPHKELADSKKIAGLWADEAKKIDSYNWAIAYEGKVIGNIDVVRHDNLWEAVMGWQIDAPFWNMGIMTEAATAVFDFLFCEVGFHRISAGHDTHNPASGKVMEKLGMQKEGLFPQYYYKKGGRGTGDAQKYGILKEEWLAKSR